MTDRDELADLISREVFLSPILDGDTVGESWRRERCQAAADALIAAGWVATIPGIDQQSSAWLAAVDD